MTASPLTRTLATILVAGVLASCGSAADPAARDRDDRRGQAADRRDRDGSKRQQQDHQRPAGDRSGKGARAETAASTSDGSGGGGAAAPTGGGGESPTQPPTEAAASSCVSDAGGDLEGSGTPPAYVDLTGSCVREKAGVVTLEAVSAGGFPTRTDDADTHASISFELTPPGGSSIFVQADAADDGWTAYLTRGDQRRELTGGLTISGSTLRLELPAADLGQSRELHWAASSSWLRSTLLTTSYAFDSAPDGSKARFQR